MVSKSAFIWTKSWKPAFTILIPLILSPIFLWEGLDISAPDCGPCEPKWKQAGGAFVILLMAFYWISECLPLPVTALCPIILYPLLQISNTEEVTISYLNSSVLLLLAGCMIALAFEYSNLHTRIALKVITLVGAQIPLLLLGIMGTAMFLSMWMNNTSTTAMMVPIVYVIMEEFENMSAEESESKPSVPEVNDSVDPETNDKLKLDEDSTKTTQDINGADGTPSKLLDQRESQVMENPVPVVKLSKMSQSHKPSKAETAEKIRSIKIMFLLGVAAAANIGGTGIITGTATNVIAQNEAGRKRTEIVNDKGTYIDQSVCLDLLELDFLGWLKFNIFPMLLCTICSWAVLLVYSTGIPKGLIFWRKRTDEDIRRDTYDKKIYKNIEKAIGMKYAQLGTMSLHELFVLLIFLLLVFLWISEVLWFKFFMDASGNTTYPHDLTPALFVCLLLFVIPKEKKYYKDFFRGGLGEGMLDPVLRWELVETKVPWGPLILIGGGSAISGGIKRSGLGDVIGKFLKENEALNTLEPWQFLIMILFIVAILTTVASNTAAASILSPVLISLSFSKNIHPLYMLVVPTVTASYAFILPISTPPNAIVYDKSDMKQIEMAIPGILLTIAYAENPSCALRMVSSLSSTATPIIVNN